MSYWLTLRRSPSSSISVIKRIHRRQFSASPHFDNNAGDVKSNNRFITAGIITSSTLAAYFLYSSSSSSSALSFADWSDPASATTPTANNNPYKFLFGESFRRRIFFNYEKRIRMRSPPEKVFEYFASVRPKIGETFMTPADLMRAVVPVFPPSESHLVREGYLQGERSPGELRCAPSKFFMLFDTNNDGQISFKEYLFFVTLLSIPESSFSVAFKMFDLDCNGIRNPWDSIWGFATYLGQCQASEIEKEEFMKVMHLMRAHNRQAAVHSDGLRAGHRLGNLVENGGVLEYFFGKDGKKRLKHDEFVSFLRELHDEIVRLEFAHYDYKLRGTISVKDFALSMVASADMKHMHKLLQRVDNLDSEPHLGNVHITPEEFKNFAKLRRELQPFSLALFSFGQINGLLTKEDFQRAAEQVCGVSLTNEVVDVIFHVFDTNCDGSLSSEEFIRVMHKRERDIAQPTEAGMFSFLSCCLQCSNSTGIARVLS